METMKKPVQARLLQVLSLRCEYPLMLHAFYRKHKLPQTVVVVIPPMTRGAQADEAWVGIAGIMVAVRSVQVDGIRLSCSSGYPFRAVPDMANLALPACIFLTVPC